MTVSHLARAIESAGLPTVSVYVEAFAPTAQLMKPPRVLTTPFLMGRPLGMPRKPEQQRAVIIAALQLLKSAEQSPTIKPFEP